MVGDGDRPPPAGIGRGIVGWYEDICCTRAMCFLEGAGKGGAYKGGKQKPRGRRFYTAGGGKRNHMRVANGRTGSGGLGPLPFLICHLAPPLVCLA